MPAETPKPAGAEAADLLLSAAWLVPDALGDPLPDGAVAIRDGRIVAVGPAAELEARWAPAETLALPHHLLAPGLVNAHGHLAMSLLRGCAEDVPLQAWLADHIWPLEAAHVDAEFARDGVRLALLEMLRAGVTSFSDMYFFPEITAVLARELGMRAQVAFPVIDIPNVWSRSAEEGIHKGLALSDQYRHDALVDIAFGPHALYTVESATLESVLMYSEELELNVQIHLHENAQEVADTRAAHGMSGIEYLRERGLLGPRLQAVHVTQATDAEIAMLAEANAHVVSCPSSNAKLACGVCPVSALERAGVNVCLGTDGAASANRLSVLAEARLASLLGKLRAEDPAATPAPSAFAMATRNGARAFGRAAEIGTLAPGKWADVIAVDTRSAELEPLYDPLAQLVHSAADGSVTHVWVGGECLLEERRARRMDEEDVLARAIAWQQRISAGAPAGTAASRNAEDEEQKKLG